MLNTKPEFSSSLQLLKQTDVALKYIQKILHKYKGYRRQFLVDDKGTVLIACFGVPPFCHEDDCFRAVKSALEISKVLSTMKVSHSIGIGTGNVYIGSVGSTYRREHAVVGDAVNCSARLAGKASVYGNLLCDEATKVGCGSRCSFIFKGEIELKGKNNKVSVYRPAIVECYNVTSKDVEIDESRFSFYGRNKELEDILASMESSQSNFEVKRFIWIDGVAGIGKTVFIKKLFEILNCSKTCLFLLADSTEKHTPYYIWRSLFDQLLGFHSASNYHV